MRPLIYHFNITSMLPAIFYSFVGILSAALSDVVHYVFERITNKLNDHQTKSVQAFMTD
ncbi:MAG: hypothetical protein ACTTK2_07630 [Hoylesella marshii]|uniref:hypothetical protein n=1 Tax=Hoylesella marshii TaxID=189722 RepID=UPI003FA04479